MSDRTATPTDEGAAFAAATETDASAVSLRGLGKRYRDTVAVEDVSLDVESGELLVLLGPSGCGKTTTLRMVAGLEAVTEGHVTIGGTDVSQSAPQDRDVAMVFQNYALYPHKTVRGNMRFSLRKAAVPAERTGERITETASLLGIDDLLDKKPAALSGGQRQRVAVGRAIAREPAVLLMDEPLSNLDAKLRVRTRSELRSLQQRLGITTLYVTHDQEEAMSIADRIAIMNDGRLEQVGTPEEIYRDPTNAFIAGFLGDPPMNLLSFSGGGRADDVLAAVARDLPDETVTLGVRPEDVYFATPDGTVRGGDPPDRITEPLRCTVTVVEPTGRAYEVTLTAGDHQLIARTRSVPTGLSEGEEVAVVFDREKRYGFDADGRRVT